MIKPNHSKGREGTSRSLCPVTNTLDILGDKWTLLVVRDLFMGKQYYREFIASPEGIPTNILADRLKRLEHQDIVHKSPYQERPVRYAYGLTEKGEDLLPILAELAAWGNRYIPNTIPPPENFATRLQQVRVRSKSRKWSD